MTPPSRNWLDSSIYREHVGVIPFPPRLRVFARGCDPEATLITKTRARKMRETIYTHSFLIEFSSDRK